MNKEINLGNLSEVPTPGLIRLPTEHIRRYEECPICKINLIESFHRESGKPKDIMRVQIGRKYPSWLTSSAIFCPNCKMVFKHSATDSNTLGRYEAIARAGGIVKLILAKDFLVSRYDTSLKKGIKKGIVVYATHGAVAFSQQKKLQISKIPSVSSFTGESFATNFLFEIKEGYKKSDGWTKGKYPFRKFIMWKQVPAISCALEAKQLFNTEDRIHLPAAIFNLSKKSSKS